MSDKFHKFLTALKSDENRTLIEAIEIGYKSIYEAYEDLGLPEYDDYTSPNFDSRGDLNGHYKYVEPLDIYVDTRSGYPEFTIYSDGGDVVHETTDINDALNFIKKTGNKLGHMPIKSYGNRWLNDMKEATIEDHVYMMDTKWNGRKTVALHQLSDDEINAIRQKLKSEYKSMHESLDEYDDITDLEHPDDIVRAFYGEDDPETVDQQLDEYNKYIDDLANIIRRYGYWSSQVREFNDTIPSELSTMRIHEAARWRAKDSRF